VQSSCNPLIGDYTHIFYMIDESDGPFFKYKMSLRGRKSMKIVDGLNLLILSLIFMFLALTPRLNSTETSLQLSENINLLRSVAYIQVSSAKGPRWTPVVWCVSFIYIYIYI
jgi:hypothetical protein